MRPTSSGWTIETAMEHVLSLLQEADRRYSARFDAIQNSTEQSLQAAQQAVLKAETAAEKRFESVNEFRNTLSDQQRNLMPRSEVTVVSGALTEKIQSVESSLSSKIYALEKQLDSLKAEREGIRGGWGYAVGLVGFLLAIGSLVMIGIRFVQTP
jgi:hypothetical protein